MGRYHFLKQTFCKIYIELNKIPEPLLLCMGTWEYISSVATQCKWNQGEKLTIAPEIIGNFRAQISSTKWQLDGKEDFLGTSILCFITTWNGVVLPFSGSKHTMHMCKGVIPQLPRFLPISHLAELFGLYRCPLSHPHHFIHF